MGGSGADNPVHRGSRRDSGRSPTRGNPASSWPTSFLGSGGSSSSAACGLGRSRASNAGCSPSRTTGSSALSKATARDLAVAGIGRGRISTIYPVFNDFTFWRGQGQSPDSTFLYYGRPGKTKGVFLLLDAIRVLDLRLPPQWRFEFILSDQPAGDRRAFLTSVEQSGLSSRVVTSRPLPPGSNYELGSTMPTA